MLTHNTPIRINAPRETSLADSPRTGLKSPVIAPPRYVVTKIFRQNIPIVNMTSEGTDSEEAKERSVHSRDIKEGDADPQMHLIRAIADFKGAEETELDALYPTIDHLVEYMYSNPPSPAAQTELTFVYEGFRVTLFQDGTAIFQEKPE